MEQGTNANAGAAANLGLVVWLVYGLLSSAGYWLSAGASGFAIATMIVATQYRRGALKIMDCTSLAYFALEMAIVLFAGNQVMQRFHLPFVWGVFAVVAWVTIIRHEPFALQYAREQTPREIWTSPTFYRMNFHLTLAWALVFTVSAILGVIAMVIGHALLLGVMIPAAGMAFGFIFSKRYPRRFVTQFESESRLQSAATMPKSTETMRSARP